MKVKIITSSEELEQFTSRKDIIISKIDIKPCDQNFFAQEWFVAVVMYEENTGNNFDWQSFHNQAVKDILCAVLPSIQIIDGDFSKSLSNAISNSIDTADELVKQLKENEDK